MSLSELIYIVIGLVVYQLLNRLLHRLVRSFNPVFYETLQLDKSRKLAPYFVFPVGFLLTFITTPVCLYAYNNTPPETDTVGNQRPFTTSGKVCLASRGVLWVSELPLLSYSLEYVAHHVLALGSLLIVLVRNLPRRPIYLIYAGLVTELFSDTVALLRLHGRNAGTSSVFRRAMLANVVSMVVLRIAPISIFVACMRQTSPDLVGGVTMYCAYLVRLTFMQSKTLGFVQPGLTQQLQARLFGKDAKIPTVNWLPRPMTLVTCAAVAIVSLSVSEYLTSEPPVPAIIANSETRPPMY
ncbi:uncharacterized protein CTRU02_210502 [Colletotrichum truncatum]|uniref:Uncharacterized protein n=1 Tax=Colletotrichum truncatum TaxID=5467 RepID=A0ACC3YP72_COLTU|nr:uncharacterized protein CTRU02_12702 [Colletotrichum truncatum]KAF6784173.1 hypothetical protein CTRU02_12702 [Colletotrichum truncatum]